MAERKWVRLRDSAGCFYDGETGFKIVRDEVKQLGERIGKLTRKKLEGLGLVYCDPPAGERKDGPGTETDTVALRIEELCDEHTKAELEEMAEGMGLEVPPKANKREIARLIAEEE